MIKDLIPKFDNLESAIKKTVRENQGEKGYIRTTDPDNMIYTFMFTGDAMGFEQTVIGIRVKNDSLQILTVNLDDDPYAYDEGYLKNNEDWQALDYDCYPTEHTLIEIANNIDAYIKR